MVDPDRFCFQSMPWSCIGPRMSWIASTSLERSSLYRPTLGRSSSLEFVHPTPSLSFCFALQIVFIPIHRFVLWNVLSIDHSFVPQNGVCSSKRSLNRPTLCSSKRLINRFTFCSSKCSPQQSQTFCNYFQQYGYSDWLWSLCNNSSTWLVKSKISAFKTLY